MEINLEKIEIVKDRTGSTYAQAKEALERTNGSVVDAIIDIEEKLNQEYDNLAGPSLKDSPIFAKVKEIVEKGNVSRILITKDDKTIINFPITVGVIGAVLVPWGAFFGVAAAVGTQCEFVFIDDEGKATDINGKVIGIYDKAKDVVMSGVDKAQTVFKAGTAKTQDIDLDEIKDAFNKGSAKLMEAWEKLEKSGKIDEVKDAVEEIAKKAASTTKDTIIKIERKLEVNVDTGLSVEPDDAETSEPTDVEE